MLTFERMSIGWSAPSRSPQGSAWIVAGKDGIGLDRVWLDSPADLAELFRVLREAAEVAGWKEKDVEV